MEKKTPVFFLLTFILFENSQKGLNHFSIKSWYIFCTIQRLPKNQENGKKAFFQMHSGPWCKKLKITLNQLKLLK